MEAVSAGRRPADTAYRLLPA
ncbi:predicted protein [Streptomyces iranensis]|uniref:Uncharacterized protein n=1 Tax=Streptomyces iranensis TaxID=576784 RepID=A0A060ZCB7_9ACTN|nr:predicted protein [Streptomyces iranensis]